MKRTRKSLTEQHSRVCKRIDDLRHSRHWLSVEEIDRWGELIEERNRLQGLINRSES